mmetsp:Transcript_34088/g.77752  ORF Transcript_34088/g.77752 Transcript_34088/m.77752 type:complete len:469 (-) Transcript_34088:70-1476(-)
MPPKNAGKGAPPVVPRPKPKAGPRLPLGEQASDEPKLRPLFWKSLDQVTPDSLWADPVPAAPFDKSLLEKQFAMPEAKMSTPRGMSNQESRKRIRVLDDKTSHVLGIAFKRLPAPDRVAMMVDTMEDFPEGLNAEALLSLNTALSEQREVVEQLQQHIREFGLSTLDFPERYLGLVGGIEHASVKLACGALIVGSANELGDLREDISKVGTCSQEIQASQVLKKCISTCLAVGNQLNRGTSRSGAAGIVLPESLLKLDELKATPPDKDSPGSNCPGTNFSALDFIVHAVVAEVGLENVQKVSSEVARLQDLSRAAQGVALDETETRCKRILTEAAKAREGLTTFRPQEEADPKGRGWVLMYNKVKKVHAEAEFAARLLDLAKGKLVEMQKWSSVRGSVKSEDWFKNWTRFLEQFGRCLSKHQSMENKARTEDRMTKAYSMPAKVQMQAEGAPRMGLFSKDNIMEGGVA